MISGLAPLGGPLSFLTPSSLRPCVFSSACCGVRSLSSSSINLSYSSRSIAFLSMPFKRLFKALYLWLVISFGICLSDRAVTVRNGLSHAPMVISSACSCITASPPNCISGMIILPPRSSRLNSSPRGIISSGRSRFEIPSW